jgi:hypothetical protein
VLETANDLIDNRKISAPERIQMLALLQYVFTLNKVSVRTRRAEIEYRHSRGHSEVLAPFLTSTLPLVHRPVATAQEVN